GGLRGRGMLRADRERGREIPIERIAGHRGCSFICLGAGGFEVVGGLGSARAVEEGFAMLFSLEAGERKRTVQVERRLARLVRREPQIAGSRQHPCLAGILVGRSLRRFLKSSRCSLVI